MKGAQKDTFEWHLQSTLFHFYSAKAFHQPIAGLCCKMEVLIDNCLRKTSTANEVSSKTEFTMSDFTTDMTLTKNKHRYYSKVKWTRSQKDFFREDSNSYYSKHGYSICR